MKCKDTSNTVCVLLHVHDRSALGILHSSGMLHVVRTWCSQQHSQQQHEQAMLFLHHSLCLSYEKYVFDALSV